jgi:D-glycero-D-manno-heptose 1,7-bisphosphate phosphatase
MRKIVFLDRDGVINKNPVYLDYVKGPSEFSFLPGSKKAIRLLNQAGFKVVIISNQTGVGKGLYSKDNLKRVTDKMLKGLKASNARLDKICYCIHHPDSGCDCRKPKTGMFKKAVGKRKFDKRNSYFVGDTERDTLAGHAFGVKTIAVLSGYAGRKDIKKWKEQPDYVAKDLLEAVGVVMGEGRR